ncbi:type II toxin-antitoxin system prevent-host-death family antitoxin [Herbiconiux sp.]|uniref:type II toxin-antitoxin system Phd/YefM family antitoxin n=1 Tax=Herbiconiux sp. TaxID=1871186 RepID=UPI0025BD48AF|nr:type II toxin-antitoxin system prevent-host-death family antitoxin [Herbiconiux sp.]
METVSVRELRNQGGHVLARVTRGETLAVTSDGTKVAELRPLRRRALTTRQLIDRRRALPAVDFDSLRADIDAVIDPAL